MKSYPVEEDAVLNSISQMLLKEDLEDGTCVFPDATVQAAQRSFSDALGEITNHSEEYYNGLIPSHNYVLSQDINTNFNPSCNYYDSNIFNNVTAKNLCQPQYFNVNEPCNYDIPALPLNFPSGSSSYGDSLLSGLFGHGQYFIQTKSGTLIPNADHKMIFDFENNRLIQSAQKLKKTSPVFSYDQLDKSKSHELIHSSRLMKRKKNIYQLEIETIAGRNKHSAVLYGTDQDSDHNPSETFDMVLLSDAWDSDYGNGRDKLRSSCGNRAQYSKGSNTNYINGVKTRRRKGVGEEDLFDLRTLLTHCAEAVASNDRETATELLFQIRTKSSQLGNGSQRLAHYFANALEARLNGIGNELYSALSAKRMSALTCLKCCRMFLSACPLIKTSNFFVNQTILQLLADHDKATTLHIIHFGIVYGFQWPSLIKRLAARPGGPPRLRITGIDLPLQGFRPAARLEETGRRLASYCKRFNVPFEYNAIAQRWECVSPEDLKLSSSNNHEITVVNSLYRFRYLLDDSSTNGGGLNSSSRDTVLSLIRSINPDMFIHGIVNGDYNSPFFMSRFKEALYYFSAVFDMVQANVPQEMEEERRIYEREGYGKEIMNVLACEGPRRIERPETYRKWQARNSRAGLRQLPLRPEIMSRVEELTRCTNSCYSNNQDFFVDIEDGRWMLQGWKGRVLYALSCWKPHVS